MTLLPTEPVEADHLDPGCCWKRATTFRVFGQPRPGGSKRAFLHAKTGKMMVIEASKNKDWRAEVKAAGMEAYDGPVLGGPLKVHFTFFLLRPKMHYGSGKNAEQLKSQFAWLPGPVKAPDTTKLIRSTEDALTGVLWVDDAQLVVQKALKLYIDRWERPGALIEVWELLPPVEFRQKGI